MEPEGQLFMTTRVTRRSGRTAAHKQTRPRVYSHALLKRGMRCTEIRPQTGVTCEAEAFYVILEQAKYKSPDVFEPLPGRAICIGCHRRAARLFR